MAKWEMVRVGDVCEVVSGSTPSTYNPELWKGSIKWVTPAEINDDSYFIYDTVRHISEQAGLKPMPMGTVLLSSRAPIGKVAIAGKEMCCNQGFKNLICSEKIHNRYLYRYLKEQTGHLNSLGRGATFKEISKSIVEQIEIPLPPLSVQKQIADILDRVSNLTEKRKAQIDKLDLLVKLRFVEMFGNPVTNPMGWGVKPLGEVFTIIDGDRGSNYPKGSDFFAEGHCLFLNAGNVTTTGFNFSSNQFIILEKDMQLRKGRLVRGDIVLTTRGTVGNVALFDDGVPYDTLRINSGMVLLRGYEKVIDAEYFIYLIRCFGVLAKYLSGSAQPQIPISTMKNIPMPLPPLALQTRFAEFVQAADKSKFTMRQSLNELEMMYKALAQSYFG